jgi:inorganic pyrophosphatase
MWRDIPSGDKPPELLNMVIEVVSGSRGKYEYHIQWKNAQQARNIINYALEKYKKIVDSG